MPISRLGRLGSWVTGDATRFDLRQPPTPAREAAAVVGKEHTARRSWALGLAGGAFALMAVGVSHARPQGRAAGRAGYRPVSSCRRNSTSLSTFCCADTASLLPPLTGCRTEPSAKYH